MLIKKYLKSILSVVIILVIGILITSILNYFGVFNDTFNVILKLIIVISALFYGGFILGKNSNKKGYIAGLKSGGIITILLLIYNLIMNNPFNIKSIIFYIIILAVSVIGGMFGITKSNSLQKN